MIYIGIDPSINSTGITVITPAAEFFYIIKPNKLTKYEQQLDLSGFKYITYDKKDNHTDEISKTKNIISITDNIISIVNNHCADYDPDFVYICIEGTAMGSVRTNCLVELAGLNYAIRIKLLQNGYNHLYIAPPSTIKKFACGVGNANKNVLTELFTAAHPDMNSIKKLDDIADSYYMARYAHHKTRVEAV